MRNSDCKFWLKGNLCNHINAPQPAISKCLGIKNCDIWEVGYLVQHESYHVAKLKSTTFKDAHKDAIESEVEK